MIGDRVRIAHPRNGIFCGYCGVYVHYTGLARVSCPRCGACWMLWSDLHVAVETRSPGLSFSVRSEPEPEPEPEPGPVHVDLATSTIRPALAWLRDEAASARERATLLSMHAGTFAIIPPWARRRRTTHDDEDT